MASTYSTNLAIELIGTGDQAGTWGNTTNTNLGTLIEQAISGYVTQAVSTGTDTTITIPNGATGVARNMYIELTGTGGASTNLIVPANKKLYFIFNNTSSGQVTVKVSGQTGVSVPNKAKVILVSNGTDIIDATNYIGSAVIGNITATSGTITTLASTSAIITTLTSTSAGITTLSSGSANITQLNSTSGTISTLASTSAAITTLSGTTLTYASASITNLTATSLVLSNLSIASANITTLTSSSATISTTLALSGGTANGVLYLNGSKVATSGSALTFDGTSFVGPNFRSNSFMEIRSDTANLYWENAANTRYYSMALSGTSTSPTLLTTYFDGTSVLNRLALDSSGNLGIGLTPVAKLDVLATTGTLFRCEMAGKAQLNIGNGGNSINYYDADSQIFRLGNGTEQMRLTSTGLGIGTSSPGSKLEVKGAFSKNTGDETTWGIRSSDTTAMAAGVGGGLIFTGLYTTGGAASAFAAVAGAKENSTSGNLLGQLRFYTTDGSGINQQRAVIDSSGNLGIGTSSPAYKLDVNGTGYIANIQFTNPSAFLSNSADALIGWASSFSGYTNGTLILQSRSSTATPIVFATGATTASERMRITDAGDVGIGTSSPACGLEVSNSGNGSVGEQARITSTDTESKLAFVNTGGNGAITQSSGAMIFQTNTANTERMRLDAAGNLGLGVTPSAWSGGKALQVKNTSNPVFMSETGGDGYFGYNAYYNGTNWIYVGSYYANALKIADGTFQFLTAASGTAGNTISFTQAMTLDASGNLGIGATTPTQKLDVRGSVYVERSTNPTNGVVAALTNQTNASNNGCKLSFDVYNVGAAAVGVPTDNAGLAFYTNGTTSERARITSGGEFIVGSTAATFGDGIPKFWAYGTASSSSFAAQSTNAVVGYINRNTDDGTLLEFRQADVTEGSISVSGNTVSYNAFAGSHWSQLQDGSKPDILRGTVMESINELCVWPGEQNERLPKSKISDTAGSKKVYGVFMAWDNDWTATNDMYVTAVGAFICRVNGSVTVQEGDLLESNGDGTARVQADDIIRSSTIGKVTSTVKTHEYDDGSYCVPTVLYCG